MNKIEIEKVANDVLAKYVPRGYAYKQFDKIFAGGKIRYKEIKTDSDRFAGSFTRYLNGQKYIIINSNTNNEGRKHFTIAHELGHYFLGHQLKACDAIDRNINEECFSKEPIEYEADYFAACLLMPAGKIIGAVKGILRNSNRVKEKNFLILDNHTYGTWVLISKTLTKSYGVSKEALTYRLKNLKMVRENI